MDYVNDLEKKLIWIMIELLEKQFQDRAKSKL